MQKPDLVFGKRDRNQFSKKRGEGGNLKDHLFRRDVKLSERGVVAQKEWNEIQGREENY